MELLLQQNQFQLFAALRTRLFSPERDDLKCVVASAVIGRQLGCASAAAAELRRFLQGSLLKKRKLEVHELELVLSEVVICSPGPQH